MGADERTERGVGTSEEAGCGGWKHAGRLPVGRCGRRGGGCPASERESAVDSGDQVGLSWATGGVSLEQWEHPFLFPSHLRVCEGSAEVGAGFIEQLHLAIVEVEVAWAKEQQGGSVGAIPLRRQKSREFASGLRSWARAETQRRPRA